MVIYTCRKKDNYLCIWEKAIVSVLIELLLVQTGSINERSSQKWGHADSGQYFVRLHATTTHYCWNTAKSLQATRLHTWRFEVTNKVRVWYKFQTTVLSALLSFCFNVFWATLFVSLHFWGSNPSSYPHCISIQPFEQMLATNFLLSLYKECEHVSGLHMLLCNQISACGLNCHMNECLVGLMFLVYDW